MRRTIAVLVMAVTLFAGAGVTSATPPPSQSQVRADAASWLQAQVTPDGSILSPYSGDPSPSITAQAVLSLASSGGDPAVIGSMMSYLETYVQDNLVSAGVADDPGVLGLLILDAIATGHDPHAFGGIDLVGRLEATQRTGGGADDGLFGSADPTYDGVYRQSLALVALDAVGDTDAAGLGWLESQQCDDGGFVSYRSDTSTPCPAVDPATFAGADTNSTSLAAIALHVSDAASQAAAAIAWLQDVQSPSGGFAYLGDSSLAIDGNSTGLGLLALTTVNGTPDPGAVGALAALQVPQSADAADRGGIVFQPQGSTLVPNLMATTQALWGLSGKSFPFVPVVNPPDPGVPVSSIPSSTPTTLAQRPSQAAPATAQSAQPAYTG